MKTFKQIYEQLQQAEVISEFERYSNEYSIALSEGKSTAAINFELSETQVALIKETFYELTGIRPGGCATCIMDAIKGVYRWAMEYKEKNEKHVEKSKSK